MERRTVHLAMLTVRASATKEMLAIIGILLFVSTSKQVTALRERNAAFYIQARMLQELQ